MISGNFCGKEGIFDGKSVDRRTEAGHLASKPEYSGLGGGRFATRVQVKRFRYVEKIHTSQGEILQTSSEISGQLPDGWQNELGTLLFKLLPAGSISGAPKAATQKLIRQAEGLPRGYYSGVFGYFDGQTLDSAVLIRFIEKVDNRYYFRSGGGITVNSQAKEEYQEILEKIYLPIQK